MLRDIDLSRVSDGKLYTSSDMVRTDCQGCKGCSSCCRGMGNSVILDPYDTYCLTVGLSRSFDQLLTESLELTISDGIALPNLRMTGSDEHCIFLDGNGRCSIHDIRPGFCRLFPLGRLYENGTFRYFLQIHECPKPGKSKIKIKKWLGIDDIRLYETFVNDWHYYLKKRQETAMNSDSPETVKSLSMAILRRFYLIPYDPCTSFYPQFYERLSAE